jgi:hypothetical protein
MSQEDIYSWDINQTGWAYREPSSLPDVMAAHWAQPGTNIRADVQAMMRQWEDDALDIGIVIYDPEDLIERLTALLVPLPIRGGTYLYCPWRKRIPYGVMSCGVGHVGWATGTRFRTERAYRRHWRQHHLGDR